MEEKTIFVCKGCLKAHPESPFRTDNEIELLRHMRVCKNNGDKPDTPWIDAVLEAYDNDFLKAF